MGLPILVVVRNLQVVIDVLIHLGGVEYLEMCSLILVRLHRKSLAHLLGEYLASHLGMVSWLTLADDSVDDLVFVERLVLLNGLHYHLRILQFAASHFVDPIEILQLLPCKTRVPPLMERLGVRVVILGVVRHVE